MLTKTLPKCVRCFIHWKQCPSSSLLSFCLSQARQVSWSRSRACRGQLWAHFSSSGLFWVR